MAAKSGTAMQLSYIPLRFVPRHKTRVDIDIVILRKMKREGKLLREVAEFFSCSTTHVVNFNRRMGLPPFDNKGRPGKKRLAGQ